MTDAYLESGRRTSWPRAGGWARQILVDYVDEVDAQLRDARWAPRRWNVRWARCRLEQQVQASRDAPGTDSPVGVQMWAIDLSYWGRENPVTWWLIDATLYLPTGIDEQLVFYSVSSHAHRWQALRRYEDLRLKLPRRLK